MIKLSRCSYVELIDNQTITLLTRTYILFNTRVHWQNQYLPEKDPTSDIKCIHESTLSSVCVLECQSYSLTN